MRGIRIAATAILAAGGSACVTPHTLAAGHFEKAADLVVAGDWAGSLTEYEQGCSLASDEAVRATCREKGVRIYAGHRTEPTATAPVASAPAVVSAADSPGSTDTEAWVVGAPQPNAYAVIIGVEHYDGLPAPTGARADAEHFAKVAKQTLGVSDAHVHLALDEHATKGGIERDVEWARTNVPHGGRIYFFFSGHGAPDPSSGSAYLLPHDGDPKFLGQSALLVSDVLAKLGQSGAKEVVVLLDSCFSGAGGRSVLAAGARPLVRVKEVNAAPTVALLSAATGSEISGPASVGSAGLFSFYLMQAIGRGMADANGDGQISMQEVSDWVRPRVARDAKKDGRDQNPRLVVGGHVSSPSELLVAWGLPAK